MCVCVCVCVHIYVFVVVDDIVHEYKPFMSEIMFRQVKGLFEVHKL